MGGGTVGRWDSEMVEWWCEGVVGSGWSGGGMVRWKGAGSHQSLQRSSC